MTNISAGNFIPNLTDFGVYNQKIVQAVNQLNETDRVFRLLVDWVGFKKKICIGAPHIEDILSQ